MSVLLARCISDQLKHVVINIVVCQSQQAAAEDGHQAFLSNVSLTFPLIKAPGLDYRS